MTEASGYDAGPAIVAAFGVAGLGETWRLAAGVLPAAPGGRASRSRRDARVRRRGSRVARGRHDAARSPRPLRSEPRWCLGPLVALAAAHRLAELVPAVGRPALVVTAALSVVVSAAATAHWSSRREPVRPEHLLPTATTSYTLSLVLEASSTALEADIPYQAQA